MDIIRDSQPVIFFPVLFILPFSTKVRFSLQTLAKFEPAKAGSGVGFLRLTAVLELERYDLKSETDIGLPVELRMLGFQMD